MAEVPQIVRDRLRRHAPAGEHPDANLLSAFTEHALTGRERVSVLDHLSRCAECREVVALSAPEATGEWAEGAAPSPLQTKISWWRSPVVHWGALTAAALVVLIAAGEHIRLRQGHSASAPAMAKYETAQQAAPASEAAPVPPEPKQSPKPGRAAPPASTSNQAKAIGAGSLGKLASEDKYAMRKSTPPEMDTQNTPAPLASAKPLKDASGTAITSAQPLQRDHLNAATPSAAASGAVGQIVAAPHMKSEAAARSQSESAMLVRRAALASRWSISNAGALQRSLDGGRSWKEVAVAEGVTFRAIATLAQDVWAGGSGGALYHSADGGEHWSPVRVQTGDRVLSGDVVRINFANSRDGVVSSSTGETWTTSDGGATWNVQ